MRRLIRYSLLILLCVACASNEQSAAPSSPSSTTSQSTTPSSLNAAPDVSALAAAIAKTQNAQAYRLALNITLSFSEGTRKAEQPFLAFTGVRAQGAYQLWYKQGLFNELPGEGQPVEMILIDGQTYARSEKFFGESKPEQWYWLTRSAITKPVVDFSDMLNLTNINAARFKNAPPEPLDGQICPAWTWEAREQAPSIIALVSAAEDKAYFDVVEQAEARLALCPDGYAHELAWELRTRHPQKHDAQSRVSVTLRLTDFGAKEIVVKPPSGVLEWGR
jgi:hypothetical protein